MKDGWWLSSIDRSDMVLLHDALGRAITGQAATATFRFRRKDDSWIWIRLLLSRHVDRASVPEVIGIWIDVTHERALAEQLAQANKLAQLGEMATGMAHELNQPLAAISLAAENAQREIARLDHPSPRLVRRLDVIVEMAGRASELIDHMRVFGRIGPESSGPVDLAEVVAKAASLISGKLRGTMVQVRTDLSETLPPVLGRTVPLEQVLINLFSNACDAYATLAEADAAREIIVKARVADAMMQVSVADRAGGIPHAVLPQIFQPFFTTKPVGSGTGPGLSISYGIITELGGTIDVCNRDGGVQFIIHLPIAQAP